MASSKAKFEVLVLPHVASAIKQLTGRAAGYGSRYRQLEIDPCAPEVGAYRLSGPLDDIVCGVHLNGNWRLAFTFGPDELGTKGLPVVTVLYIGQHNRKSRQQDIWNELHELFGVENPPEDHLKPDCCDDGLPVIALDDYTDIRSQSKRFFK